MQNETAQSTVLLNGEQPKKELTVLAKKAEELRDKLREANEAGDDKSFTKYTNQLKATTKQMNQMTKESFDLKKVLDDLSGASIRDLTKAKSMLDAQLRSDAVKRGSDEWKKLQEELKHVKAEMSNIHAESRVGESTTDHLASGWKSMVNGLKEGGSTFLGMIPTFGLLTGAVAGVAGGFKFAKSVMESTRATSKEFKADLEGLETAWTFLLKSIATGNFTFSGLIEAFNAGRDYKLELGSINKEQQALNVSEAKAFNRRQELLEQQRNVNLSAKERLAAGKEIIRISEEEGKIKQDIADREYNNTFKRVLGMTKMSKGEYESFMENYNKKDFKAISDAAIKYNKHFDQLQNGIKQANSNARGDNAGMAKAYQDELNQLSSSTDKETKKMSDFYRKYNMTTSDDINKVVEAQVKSIKVKGEVLEENQRIIRTNNKLEKELLDKSIKDAAKEKEDQAKKDLEAVDKWSLTEQEKFKQRYLKNQDSEEVYQINLVNIAREALVWKQKLQVQGSKEYLDYGNQIQDIDVKRKTDTASKALAIEKQNFETLSELNTKAHRAELDKAELALQSGVDTKDVYDNKVLAINKAFYDKQLADAKVFEKKMSEWTYQNEDIRLSTTKEINAKVEKSASDAQNAQNAILIKGIKDRADIEKEVEGIERKYGIDPKQSKQKEYANALTELKTAKEKELKLYEDDAVKKAAIEKKYEKDVSKIRIKQAEQTAEDISKVSSELGNLSSNLQQAETLSIENKYAAKLKAAKGDAEQTKAIEEQMEAEKVEVKKKYADIDFAITSAKIISSTALAVMKAWELGPVIGPILAFATGATGLAELDVANEQRQAIQNLWTGGFTEDGGKFEPRGIVHAGEFVANQDSVRNIPMRKVFNLVDYAQRTNRVAQISSEDIVRSLGIRNGYANGGFVATVPSPSGSSEGGVSKQDLAMMYDVIAQNNAVIQALHSQIQNGIRADVSIAGKNGISEQTTMYNKLLSNAERG